MNRSREDTSIHDEGWDHPAGRCRRRVEELTTGGGLAVLCALMVVLGLGLPAQGATVSGSITYDGAPILEAFPDITGALVFYYDYGTEERTYGEVNLATGTYAIAGLAAAESGMVQVEIDRSQPANNDGWDLGDLIATALQAIADPNGAYTLDLAVLYWLHFLSPFDSATFSGNDSPECTDGPGVPVNVLVEWEPIPRAHSYEVSARFETCDGTLLAAETATLTEQVVEVTQGLHGEDRTRILLGCAGEVQSNLCIMPYVGYRPGTATQAYYFHSTAGGGGDRGLHPENALVVPAVASLPGSGATYWSSQVVVVNWASSEATVELYFTPRDEDGSQVYQSATETIPAGASVVWDDVLQQVFGTTGAGSLEIRGSELSIDSRTWTPDPEGGSYGQGIPVLAAQDLLRSDGSASAIAGGVVENQAFRTNLGLCEVWGESATIEIVLYDAQGTELGSTQRALRAYENTQVNRVVNAILGQQQLEDGIIEVTLIEGNGRVGGFVSIVDNATDDPTYRLLQP